MRVLVERMLMPHVYIALAMAEPRLEVVELKYRHTISPRIPLFRRSARYGSGVLDCTFSLQRGEILGLVGANGAGKTTLLRLIAGILQRQAGEIRLEGNIATPLELRSIIGHMPEHVRWNGSRTPLGIIEEFCILSDEATNTAEKIINLVGLTGQIDEPLHRLSQGMRQRLSLGVALIGSPDILLLDEPFNGLDPIASASFQKLLKSLQQKGVTIIVSSHFVHDLSQLVDRIAIMHRGQLVEEGTMEEVSSRLGFSDLYRIEGMGSFDIEAHFDEEHIIEYAHSPESWSALVRGASQKSLQEIITGGASIVSWTPYQPSLVDLLRSATGLELEEMSFEVSPQILVPLRGDGDEDE